jgi:hypothetical protein
MGLNKFNRFVVGLQDIVFPSGCTGGYSHLSPPGFRVLSFPPVAPEVIHI